MNEWQGPILACYELSKFYPVGDGLFALSNVELEVEKGQFVVIMGPSGSGKSTLLNILGGIDRPSHGEVLLNGRKYSRMGEDDLAVMRRRELGIVFQFFNLLPELTASENIGMPMRLAGMNEREIMSRVMYLLEATGLMGRANHYPVELSGGEQQRVAIARALAPKPSIVLADEPTGSLDRTSAAQMMDLIAGLRRRYGLTVLMVTHDMEIAAYADRVLTLRDGALGQDVTNGDTTRPMLDDEGRLQLPEPVRVQLAGAEGIAVEVRPEGVLLRPESAEDDDTSALLSDMLPQDAPPQRARRFFRRRGRKPA